VQNVVVIEADRQPGILARMLGSMLQTAREVAGLSYEGAPFWEKRGHNFDILSFAGTTDRIGVIYLPIIGAEIAAGDLHGIWSRIEAISAAGLPQSRAILERHLAALS
jgi:hypothetical protein